MADAVDPDVQAKAPEGASAPEQARRDLIERAVTHRDEITAIQLITEAKECRVALADIQELADRISQPPHNWTPDIIWAAYEVVDVGKVRHSDRHASPTWCHCRSIVGVPALGN